MFVEGHIETTAFKESVTFLKSVGLDTAGEHCLLDQPIAFGTKCQVAEKISQDGKIETDFRNQKRFAADSYLSNE